MDCGERQKGEGVLSRYVNIERPSIKSLLVRRDTCSLWIIAQVESSDTVASQFEDFTNKKQRFSARPRNKNTLRYDDLPVCTHWVAATLQCSIQLSIHQRAFQKCVPHRRHDEEERNGKDSSVRSESIDAKKRHHRTPRQRVSQFRTSCVSDRGREL